MATVIRFEDLVPAIEVGPDGPAIGAFLDVEGVVVAGDPLAVLHEGKKRRSIEDTVSGWSGQDATELAGRAAERFPKALGRTLFAEARELVAAHRRKGHTIALVSSATELHVWPLAALLGVEHVLATTPELDGGRFTGATDGPVLEGDAVAEAIEKFAAEHGLDLDRSYAYASRDDSGLVQAPVCNVQRVRFESRGPVGIETIVRSVAAYGTMIPSMLSGVAVGLLNRDRTEIAQFGVNTWVDRLFAITGVKLRVHGEENLWAKRPAVFIYNHRNNFDPYVVIKLVRRDWGSVGKKELAGPLVGVAQWLTPNVAYVDRSNPEKAVESLAPVTELLRRGVSVLVAPEGTRSRTGELGPFKKGPFHMAMSAGVPIVPIVIHNADRVAERGAAIIRKGTIEVTVLPPIDVLGWRKGDLDERIEEVRQHFIETLAAPFAARP